jgi:hypothetical protein
MSSQSPFRRVSKENIALENPIININRVIMNPQNIKTEDIGNLPEFSLMSDEEGKLRKSTKIQETPKFKQ